MKKISTVYIEISGICNAKCPYCVQHKIKKAGYPGEVMPPGLFERILDHLFRIGILDKSQAPHIDLFNWGEPFLNPDINDILRILMDKGLRAGISSNFIASPKIEKKLLSVINHLTFSISGFSQDSYGRIHGAPLSKVLDNFEKFYGEIREHSPRTDIDIAWHRYLFNESEFWKAYRYFNRPGISFKPTPAYMNDLTDMLGFIDGELPADRKGSIKDDLFLDHIARGIDHCSKKPEARSCPAWESLVIDEVGQLLLCCGATRYAPEHVLGKVLEMSADDIWRRKFNDPLCSECLPSGLPMWAYHPEAYNNRKPWPSGGGLDRVALWFQYYKNPRSKMRRILLNLPGGENMLEILKSVERSRRQSGAEEK